MGRKIPNKSLFDQKWEIPLLETCTRKPLTCCFFCCCACVPAYQHRLTLIGDIKNYKCCDGRLGPCSDCCDAFFKSCPEVGLPCEVCCCLGTAVLVNRDIIRERFRLEVTPCEDCLLMTLCICTWTILIMKLCGKDVPDAIENCVDCLFFSILGCMNTQHEAELVKRGVIPESQFML